MDYIESVLLEAAKDTVVAMEEYSCPSEEITSYLDKTFGENRSEEFKDELEILKIEVLEYEKENLECEIESLKYDLESLDGEYMDFDEYGSLVDLRDEKYEKELSSLEEKLASKEERLNTINKELEEKEPKSLDDLIKNATDKAKDQPTIESPTKELER